MRRCPDCGCADVRYRRGPSWLAVVCGWCGLELHGIEADVIDGEVANEAA